MAAVSPSSVIDAAIARLRSLTQISVQSTWHYWDGDLPISQAAAPETWQNWAIAELNGKQHLAWLKGRQVRWLGQVLTVPADLNGYPLQGLCLRLALTWWAESAQIFVNGQLVQEGDLFDCSTRICLGTEVQVGEAFAIALRLVSPGHDDGALVRSLALYEIPSTPSPAVAPEAGFVADELAVLQLYLQTFTPEKLEQVAKAICQIDWSVLPERFAFDSQLIYLRQQLTDLSPWLKQRQIKLLGHAHLDMAWLWPVEATWQAAERTFQSVLSLQTDFPELVFCHSTPALYAWMEQHRPDVLQSIQQQIQMGRWEAIGGLWIEPELNLIGGESLVRQILYGQRYYQEKFGQISPIAWLPDTFGFPWQLPQFLQQGGIEFFVTQKLRWNDTTQFPYELFIWQAPDGSQVFSLMSAPIGEGIDPVKMATYACQWEQQTGIPIALWLPGVGDHGGGPTRDMLEVARRWQQSPFFPTLEFTTAAAYVELAVSSQRSAVSAQQSATYFQPPAPPSPSCPVPTPHSPFPVWQDELYLEFHRGCYTSHGDQKWFNRRAEDLLYQAELWASLVAIATGELFPQAELDLAWKRVLFNQFHDILPGSSIPQVFVDANRDWQAALQTGEAILAQSLRRLATQIAFPEPPVAGAQPLVVFNSLNGVRSQIVRCQPPASAHWQVLNQEGHPLPTQMTATGELLFLAEKIPSIGYRNFWLIPSSAPSFPSPDSLQLKPNTQHPAPSTPAWILDNGLLRVMVNPLTGDLDSLLDLQQQREILREPGNQLQAFQDQGQYWDAWNIDPNYAQYPLSPSQLKEIAWIERGPLEYRLRVIRQIGASQFQQDYILQAASPVLHIATTVDWQERHVMVKAAFPLALDADFVTYEIPCGAIQRSTRPQTEADKAKWEVPALRWADLTDSREPTSSYGLSLLSDSKHGYDCQPDQMRLTLLRGSEWPDPDADRGLHQFTYALYPHAGSWQAAQTVQRALELNLPLQVVMPPAQVIFGTGRLPTTGQLLHLESDHLVLMALKQAEDSTGQWLLRCYECTGEKATLQLHSDLNLQVEQAVDLLERPVDNSNRPEPDTEIQPWAIASWLLTVPPSVPELD